MIDGPAILYFSIVGGWGTESGLSVAPNPEIVFLVRVVHDAPPDVAEGLEEEWLDLPDHVVPAVEDEIHLPRPEAAPVPPCHQHS